MAKQKPTHLKVQKPPEETRWENEGGHLPDQPAPKPVPPTSPPEHFPGAKIVKILNSFLQGVGSLRA